MPLALAAEKVFADSTIEELDLPITTQNALLRAGVATVGQLLRRDRTALVGIRNLGWKRLDEIEDALLDRGLSLGRPIYEPPKTCFVCSGPVSDGRCSSLNTVRGGDCDVFLLCGECGEILALRVEQAAHHGRVYA